MNQQWTAIEAITPADLADPVSNFLHEQGALGVVIEEGGSASELIKAYFDPQQAHEATARLTAYLSSLAVIFPHATRISVTVVPVPDENWAIIWQEHFKPISIGASLMVSPPWETPKAPGRHVIVIEPAEAFGTGTHETTQGCLELLEQAVEELKGPRDELSLLDVGCGSGILAVAAAKWGLKRITAVDNDPVAVESARKNASLNKVEDRIEFVCVSLADLEGRRDLVVANLDTRSLLEHSAHLVSLCFQGLILSGAPVGEWERVTSAFTDLGIVLRREILKAEWASGLFSKM
ncbi:MAG: 50S ribosomal protein L11 methyltransferase [Deltaproteobacteria bacterium]|nr:50S ribosomal protein L11 methyltransferase [Deltaproteobacteria bacterium]